MLHVQRQAGVLVSNGTELTPSESLFTSDDEQVRVHVLICVISKPDVRLLSQATFFVGTFFFLV